MDAERILAASELVRAVTEAVQAGVMTKRRAIQALVDAGICRAASKAERTTGDAGEMQAH